MVKTAFLACFMIFLSAAYSFGQGFVWATASGSGGRTIPMASVRLETMRVFNQFDRFHFHWDTPMEQNQELSIYRDRATYRNFLAESLSRTTIPARTHYYRQIISWLDNYTNFVFAYSSQVPGGFSGGRIIWYRAININFVMGNEITSIFFIDANRGHNYPTQNAYNRRIFEEIIDIILANFPQTSPRPASVPSGSIPQTSPRPASAPSDFRLTVGFGYNFALGMPLGFTVGYGDFYTSWNFRFGFNDGPRLYGSPSRTRQGIHTGETVENGIAFTVGWAFNLIPGRLRLPIGIGMSLTDTYYQYDHNGSIIWYTGYGSLINRSFIMEAGLQLILGDMFYISSTVRGFSSFGFTVGAGVLF